jgi:two-component system, LytTR family, sensor kinase
LYLRASIDRMVFEPSCAWVSAMLSPNRRQRFLSQFAIVFGIWAAIAVVLTGQSYLIAYLGVLARSDLAQRNTSGISFFELLLSSFTECFVWVFLTLAIFWLVRRFPLGQGKWSRSLAVHVGACLLCGFLEVLLSVLAAEIIRQEFVKPTISMNVLFLYFAAKLNNNIFFYWAIVAVAHVVRYYRQFRERELHTSQLETKLAQTQLQILKMQLHPHFLFNTLNAISALIHQDVELADRMIARLGDLLRTTLDNANQQEVPFKQELDFIQPYLEIEKARLGSRLTVDLQIEPAVMDARVPNLILQPLVENAIRHGIAGRPGPGRIRIHAHRDNGTLRLAISDSGPGLKAVVENGKGIGLANTRARLEKLYGPRQQLELSNGPDGGLQVGITIPFHEIARDAVAEAS